MSGRATRAGGRAPAARPRTSARLRAALGGDFGLALGLVLLGAAALRFWRLDTGLPNHPSPDEPTLVGLAARIGAGDLNPHFFSYGTLWPYVLTAGFGVLYNLGRWTGRFASLADFEAAYFLDPTPFFVTGRLLSAALSVATVAVVYALGRRLASPGVGLLAAATLAAAPLHVEYSRTLLTDAPVTFAVGLAFWLILRHAEPRRSIAVWMPALAVGLATSVKYTAAALVIPLLVGACLRDPRARAIPRLVAAGKAALGVAAGFVAGTPFALLDHATFASDVYARYLDGRRGQHGFALDVNGFAVYVTEVLPQGMGLVAAVLGAIGLATLAAEAVRDGRAGGVLLALFVVPYGLVIGWSATPFDRYVLPLVPFFALGAALTARWVAAALPAGGPRQIAWACVGLAVLTAPAVSSLSTLVALAKPDTRDLGARWIAENVASGTSVATELYGPALPTGLDQLRARIVLLEAGHDGRPEIARQLERWRRKLAALASTAETTPSPPGAASAAAPTYVVYTLVLGSSVPDAAEVLYSLAELRARGVSHVVLTSEMWDRYTRFPDRYPDQARFHKEVRLAGRVVLELDAMLEGCARRFERLWALGMGEVWCRRYRGPSIRIIEIGGRLPVMIPQ